MNSAAPAPRATGCLFDTPHHRKLYKPALGPQGLFTISPMLTTGVSSLAMYEALTLNQGPSGSCEGNAGAMAAWMAFLAANDPLPWFPSQDAIYKDARCMERVPNPNGSFPPLTDTGAMTADVVTIFQSCGLKKMGPKASDGRNSDVDPATMNDEPRLDELDEEAETPVLVEAPAYAVDLTDTQQALAVIQAALDAKYPVRIDIICDNAFQRFFQSWTKSMAPLSACNPNDPGAGGHAIVLSEMKVTSALSVTLAGLNSWGDCGAPPLVAEGVNQDSGHWQGDANWFKQSVQQATVWACKRLAA